MSERTTVVVGYVPNQEGEAALSRAVAEARARDGRLLVVNSSRGDALVDERYADDEQSATCADGWRALGSSTSSCARSGAARRTRRSLRSPRSAAQTLW